MSLVNTLVVHSICDVRSEKIALKQFGADDVSLQKLPRYARCLAA